MAASFRALCSMRIRKNRHLKMSRLEVEETALLHVHYLIHSLLQYISVFFLQTMKAVGRMRFNKSEVAALAAQPSHKFEKEGVLFVKERQEGFFRRTESESLLPRTTSWGMN